MSIILIGAMLVIGGVLYMAGRAIWQGRLSGASRRRTMVETTTLEPQTRGTPFDLKSNWIGLALIAIGAVLLFAGAAMNPA